MTKITIHKVDLLIVFFASNLILISCSTQRESFKDGFKIIELKNYYNGKGAIIPADNPQYFTGQLNIEKTTPNMGKLREAETILKEDLYNYYKKIIDGGRFYFNIHNTKTEKDSIDQLYKFIENEKEKIREYYRYYMSYLNNKGEEILVINLFNLITTEAKKIFANWQNEYIFGTGDFFEENTRFYLINLTKKEIEYESD